MCTLINSAMNKKYLSTFCAVTGFILVLGSLLMHAITKNESISGAPPFGISEEEVPKELSIYDIARNWVRPDGPARVGLQVGHWKNDEVPAELERLKGNTGAFGAGKMEWEVNYKIANEIAKLLEPHGIVVDVLPATIPPKYWSDVFVAIHADGSTDTSKSGYKFAGPWRDLTGKSEKLVAILDEKYEAATGLEKDPNITRNMRGYYAFSWWRNEHAIHPMTVGIIAETGFLTNKADQRLIVNNPQISAKAIADGLLEYLSQQNLL